MPAADTCSGSIGLPMPADLEVQLHLVGVGVAHLGDLLAARDLLAFLHEDLAVVRVRRQVRVVVLDDDELAVAAQSGAGVDDLAGRARDAPAAPPCRRCRCPSGSRFSENAGDDLARRGPHPVELLVVVRVAGDAAVGAASVAARDDRRRRDGSVARRRRRARRCGRRCRAASVAQRLLGVRLLQRLRLRLVVVGVARDRRPRRRRAGRRHRRTRVARSPAAPCAAASSSRRPRRAARPRLAPSPGASSRSTWPTRIRLMFSMLFHAASSR